MTIIFSKSRTIHPQSTPSTLDETVSVMKESADHLILGETFNAKVSFEKHLRSVSRAIAQRLGIMR